MYKTYTLYKFMKTEQKDKGYGKLYHIHISRSWWKMVGKKVNVNVDEDTWRCLIRIKLLCRFRNIDQSVKWLIQKAGKESCLDVSLCELAKMYKEGKNE